MSGQRPTFRGMGECHLGGRRAVGAAFRIPDGARPGIQRDTESGQNGLNSRDWQVGDADRVLHPTRAIMPPALPHAAILSIHRERSRAGRGTGRILRISVAHGLQAPVCAKLHGSGTQKSVIMPGAGDEPNGAGPQQEPANTERMFPSPLRATRAR